MHTAGYSSGPGFFLYRFVIASALMYASAWMVRVGLNPLMVGKVELPITNRFGMSQDWP
jgi:hypothetical protein